MRSKRTVSFSVCIRFRVTFTGKTYFFLPPVALAVSNLSWDPAPFDFKGSEKLFYDHTLTHNPDLVVTG